MKSSQATSHAIGTVTRCEMEKQFFLAARKCASETAKTGSGCIPTHWSKAERKPEKKKEHDQTNDDA